MRFVIYGPGGVGGTIAARLHQGGEGVVLIGRGEHARVLQRAGLRFVSAEGEQTLRIPTVLHPAEVDWQPDDVVLLTMKSQHTADALDQLSMSAPMDIAVVCAQNGVANERMAIRRFANVYGMLINLPAMHLSPGEVLSFGEGVSGILDSGRFPRGLDDRVVDLTATLANCGFLADPDPKIMRKKYAKLLLNLGNALEAATDGARDVQDLADLLQQEARACFDAAGIECGELGEAQGVGRKIYTFARLPGQERFGGSTWQSINRHTGSIETDFLNGEIAQLGRLHGVPTPVNELCQSLVRQMLRNSLPVGHYSVDSVRAMAAAARLP